MEVEDGGYDCDFVEELPDDLACPICLLASREPHLISCCGRKLCHSCVLRIQFAGQPCPCCREEGFDIMKEKAVERRILGLKVYCKYKGKGCNWTGELRDLEKHQNSCEMSCSDTDLIVRKNEVIDQQAQQIKKLEDSNRKLYEDIAGLHKELEKLKVNETANVHEKNRMIEDQTQRLKIMRNEITKLQESKAEQERMMKNSIKTLSTENEELKRKLSEKQAPNPAHDLLPALVSDLRKDIQELKTENENLRHELHDRPFHPPPPHHHHGPPRHGPPRHGPPRHGPPFGHHRRHPRPPFPF